MISSVISETFYIQFVSVSLFSSFSLPLVGGQGLLESVCHSVYCHPALNCDTGVPKAEFTLYKEVPHYSGLYK